MAAYDIFMVYANEDKEMADLLVRRLRALKFKVRYNKAGEDATFDAKDARDSANSESMVVLWSEAAVKSDWVRAAASVGHSRPGMLVQLALDDTVPYEPFSTDHRHSVDTMTTRTIAPGFYEAVDALGGRSGRTDLRAWMDLKKSDEDGQAAWLAAHPEDPLALHAEKLAARRREAEAEENQSAAAGAAAVTASAAAAAAAAIKAPETPVRAAPRAQASAPLAVNTAAADDDLGSSWTLLGWVLAALLLFFILGWMFRSRPAPPAMMAGPAAYASCPAGQIDAAKIDPALVD